MPQGTPIRTIPAYGETARFLVSEAQGYESRAEVDIPAHGTYEWPCGLVMGLASSGGDSGKYKPFDPDATDGAQTAAGILYATQPVNAAAARATVIVRLAEVNVDLLEWYSQATIEAADKTAALASLASAHIVGR